MSSVHKRLHIGCCGFAVSQTKYFEQFDCVEIDSTLYNLPRETTAAAWRSKAPPHFQFAMKAWQVITHPASSSTYKRTRLDNRDREHCGHFGFNPTIRWAWDETYRTAQALGAFMVLFQSPASFRDTSANQAKLNQFFEKAKRGRLTFGWEPRGAWNPDTVQKLCRELELIHVTDPFQSPPLTTRPFRYYRLHGITGTYTNEELGLLENFCQCPSPVYCLFNNTASAQDAVRFRKLLGQQKPSA